MTNEEKFIEVFGFKPDTESLIMECPSEEWISSCPYYEELDGGCHCEIWWHHEYINIKGE